MENQLQRSVKRKGTESYVHSCTCIVQRKASQKERISQSTSFYGDGQSVKKLGFWPHEITARERLKHLP